MPAGYGAVLHCSGSVTAMRASRVGQLVYLTDDNNNNNLRDRLPSSVSGRYRMQQQNQARQLGVLGVVEDLST